MIWTLMSHMPAIVLVATDVASVYISAMFFSARIRRWSYRKRWGALPPTSAQFDLILKAVPGGSYVLSGNLARLRQAGFVRNPFEPNAREGLEARMTPQAAGTPARRPTFRRSIALQQRIARRERFDAGCAPSSSRWQTEARPASLQSTADMSSPYSRPVFGLGHIQNSQHA
jgi:hypothetical protein